MSKYVEKSVTLDPGNRYPNTLTYGITYSRTGKTIHMTVTIKPKYRIHALAGGWTFGIYKTNNSAICTTKKVNWELAGGSTYTLVSNISCNAGTTDGMDLRVGCLSMDYNGRNRSAYVTVWIPAGNIIPGKPSLSLSWTDGTSYWDSVNNKNVYRLHAFDDSQRWNRVVFNSAVPANAARVTINVDKYYNKRWNYIAQYNPGEGKTFNMNDKDGLFRAHAYSTSATWDTASSDYIYWMIDNISDKVNNLWFDTTRPVDNVKINWNAVNPRLWYSSVKYRLHFRWGENYSKHTYVDCKDVTSTTVSLEKLGIWKGASFCVSIESGNNLEWSHQESKQIWAIRDTPPYFTNASVSTNFDDASKYNHYFNGNIIFKWPNAADDQKDKIYYKKFYAVYKNGAWGNWIYINSNTDLSYTINGNNYVQPGEKIKFAVIPSDNVLDGAMIQSQVLTRAAAPNNPTNIQIHSTQYKHLEKVDKITWNTVKCSNGLNASYYNVTLYICDKDNWEDPSRKKISSQKVYTNSCNFYDISNIERGKYFTFVIQAVDVFGLASSGAYSYWVRKNQRPSSPQSFRINQKKLNVYQNVPLIWDAATDPDNDALTYKIYFSTNDTTYNEIGTTSNLTFTHDISKLAPNTKLYYKIKAIDIFGIDSPLVKIKDAGKLHINTKPKAPGLLYPSSKIHDKNPRIVLIANGDIDADDIAIKINVNGQDYNSLLQTSYFNKSRYAHNDNKIILECPLSLKSGTNDIKIKVNDGYQDSDEMSYKITYEEPTLSKIDKQDLIITKEIYDKFTVMINDIRKAYGQSQYKFPAVTQNSTLILTDYFNTLYNKASDVNNFLNVNYPGKDRKKIKPIIINSNFIKKDIYNSIVDIITNL